MSSSFSKLDPNQVIQEFVPPPSELIGGAKTVGATTEALGEDTPLQVGVTVLAHPDNAGTIYICASEDDEADDGYILAAGAEKFLSIDNLNKVFVVASEAAQEVRYIGS